MFRIKTLRFTHTMYGFHIRNTCSLTRVKFRCCHPLSRTVNKVGNVQLALQVLKVPEIACRYKSNGDVGIYVEYDDLLHLIEDGGVTLIDVRDALLTITCYRYKSNGDVGIYVEYDDLLHLIEDSGVTLIDVRDAKEIQETGEFPGAYNIPLQDLKKALQLKEEKFKELYGFDKPKPTDTNVVFASLKSVKSSAALEIAHKLGLTKTRQYVNGYEEWVEKQRVKAAG